MTTVGTGLLVVRMSLTVAALLLIPLAIGSPDGDAQAQTSTARVLRVAPVWRASLSSGPDTRPYIYRTPKEAYAAYKAWLATTMIPPTRQEIDPEARPCGANEGQSNYFNGVAYNWCHNFQWYYGTTPQGSGVTSVVSNGPLCPEDFRLVNVRPPIGGTAGFPRESRVACEAWTQPAPTQCPSGSCNGLDGSIFPEDSSKRQVEVDYAPPGGTISFSRQFSSSVGGFLHSYQTPIRRAYDLGDLAGGTANVNTGCLSSRIVLRDPGSGATIAIIPYCFTYLTDDAVVGRYEIHSPLGVVMQMDSAGNPLDPWNSGNQLAQRGSGYALIKRSTNSVDFYDSNWLLGARVFADGRFVSFSYEQRNLTAVTDQFGRRLAFSYDDAGRLMSMTDPAGGRYNYDHSLIDSTCRGEGCQQIAQVTYPDNSKRTYHWNEGAHIASPPPYGLALLTGTTDEAAQRSATFKYSGRLAKSTERAGSTLRYEFTDFRQGQTTVKDPLGTSRTYYFTAAGGLTRLWAVSSWCPSCLFRAEYDANGNQTSRQDFNGNTTCYAYDPTRNLETKRVEGPVSSGTCSTALTAPPTGARVISTQWHPDWRLETRSAEPDKLTTIVYNGQGATCAPSSGAGRRQAAGGGVQPHEQATTDATGALGFGAGLTGTARTWTLHLHDVRPGADRHRSQRQDDHHDVLRRTMIRTWGDAAMWPPSRMRANHVTRVTAYNLHGQPTQIVDPNGRVTDLTYDPGCGSPAARSAPSSRTFTYDPTGLLTNDRVAGRGEPSPTALTPHTGWWRSPITGQSSRLHARCDGQPHHRASDRQRRHPRQEHPTHRRCTQSSPASDRNASSQERSRTMYTNRIAQAVIVAAVSATLAAPGAARRWRRTAR